MPDNEFDMITFDEAADLDWSSITSALIYDNSQVEQENIHLIHGPVNEVQAVYVNNRKVWPIERIEQPLRDEYDGFYNY